MGKSTKKQVAGTKRHQKPTRSNIETGVTKPSVKRLTRQAGVKRTAATVLPITRTLIDKFLDEVLDAADAFREIRNKPTLKVAHCNRALKHVGHSVYGYADDE